MKNQNNLDNEILNKKFYNVHPSIIITIHNKEELIARVLQAIVTRTQLPFELVLVFDGCNDNSEKISRDTLKRNRGLAKQIKILHAPDVFETKANNIGMKAAEGNYFILVQDDMIVEEDGWEKRILWPLLIFNDVFAVSARAAHDNIWKNNEVKCINLIDFHINPYLPRNKFYIRDSCNRGPFAVSAERIKKLNYFDEDFAPLTWDDADICFRAYKEFGWISGVYGINILSKDEWGTTRKKDKASFWGKIFLRNMSILYTKHKDLMDGSKHDDTRELQYPLENKSLLKGLKRIIFYSLKQGSNLIKSTTNKIKNRLKK